MTLASPTAYAPPPQGLIVELVTPLREDGGFDSAGFSRLVARVVTVADGILAGGPGLGEALDLPLSVRHELFVHLLANVAGRVPLFFGITRDSWEETRKLAKAIIAEFRASKYNGSLYLADLPLWYHSNRGLPQVCHKLIQEAGLPLLLLNLPEVIARRAPLFKRRNIRTQVFKKLAQLPGVTGVIHQGEIRRFLNYHFAAAFKTEFAFYEGDEGNFLTRPGTWGVLSWGAQLFPAFWRQVARACLHPEEVDQDHGLRLEIWDLSRRLMTLTQSYRLHPASLLKSALAAQGVLDGAVTALATPAAPESQKERLLALVAAMTD